MEKYYLAVDIGASSGRLILGHLENGRMVLEEIYRFPNGMTEVDGEKIWDIDGLFGHVVEGMKKCKELGKIPVSVGIDTWAVDFVLLDKENRRLGNAVAYRDDRTKGMDAKVYEKVSLDELYATTGIQKQMFNTIYQLMSLKEKKPELLDKAETFLMIPDYLNFLLSGVKAQEYTNATTTQLVNPQTRDWDKERMELLGFPTKIFLPISEPGTTIGYLSEELQRKVGFTCNVVLPATHDTGSAVVAVPSNDENVLYISSGTWSLMGTELKESNCGKDAMLRNFTNEGGYNKTYRFLKNIMGLWMIQSVRHELMDAYSFAKLCEMAEEEKAFPSRVDVNDDCFLAPKNMRNAIVDYCKKTNQTAPQTVGEYGAVIYQSLADCYGKTVREIEHNTKHIYSGIHIIGGGSNAAYLNQLTANATGKTVYAGPSEATAIGNVMAQMIEDDVFENLKAARACVYRSFDIKVFEPEK